MLDQTLWQLSKHEVLIPLLILSLKTAFAVPFTPVADTIYSKVGITIAYVTVFLG